MEQLRSKRIIVLDRITSQIAAIDNKIAEGKAKYKSVAVDGLTLFMSVMEMNIEDDVFEETELDLLAKRKRRKKGQQEDVLRAQDRFQLGWQGWGAVGKSVLRIMMMTASFARKYGLTVYHTCQLDADPKNTYLQPAWSGQYIKSRYRGIYDFIGYAEIEKKYPPTFNLVDLEGDSDFVCKCCDTQLQQLIRKKGKNPKLNITKLLSYMGERKAGNIILCYGDNGIGKTYAISTLPQPILMFNLEERDPRRVLGSFIEEGGEIEIINVDLTSPLFLTQ